MANVSGKTILITGATSGIGEACARMLGAQGADLVLWARREDRLKRLRDELVQRHGIEVVISAIDVRDRDRITREADWLSATDNTPHILINNAGLARGLSKFYEGNQDDWDEMIDTNIKGLLNVSRAIVPHMVKLNRGHILNIGSTAGHVTYPNGNVYAATKFAVKGLSEGMNLDLSGTQLKVSSVDPGFVETEFSEVRFHGDKERAKQTYKGFRPLSPADVADVISFVVNLPDHVNIPDLILVPTPQRNIFIVDKNP